MDNHDVMSTLIHHGNPVLAQVAEPVPLTIPPYIHDLVDKLMDLMLQENGVGIAAPQIGYSQQIMIIASRPNLRYPKAPLMEPLPMINPKILGHSKQKILGWEGCLSVPGLRGQVERYETVDVCYYDLRGNQQQQQYQGFVARIIQHEFDHLIGKVFVDRVTSADLIITEAEYMNEVL